MSFGLIDPLKTQIHLAERIQTVYQGSFFFQICVPAAPLSYIYRLILIFMQQNHNSWMNIPTRSAVPFPALLSPVLAAQKQLQRSSSGNVSNTECGGWNEAKTFWIPEEEDGSLQVAVLVSGVSFELSQSGVYPELRTGLHGVILVVMPER